MSVSSLNVLNWLTEDFSSDNSPPGIGRCKIIPIANLDSFRIFQNVPQLVGVGYQVPP